jgi:UDP-3-O-[3-hydroxymyristoyl] N-acetylglucosamine deacetylase/3-hydroxyacyl-[acyl-carrier-protein] dehydratase
MTLSNRSSIFSRKAVVGQAQPKEFFEIDSSGLFRESARRRYRGGSQRSIPHYLLVDYKNPALGTQHTSLVSLEDEFVNEFAMRTFCFLSEIES